MSRPKLIPIPCEIKFADDGRVFHVIELKTGKRKLVAYGRVFPIRGLKRFIKTFEKEYGVKIENAYEFIREVKAFVAERRALAKQ